MYGVCPASHTTDGKLDFYLHFIKDSDAASNSPLRLKKKNWRGHEVYVEYDGICLGLEHADEHHVINQSRLVIAISVATSNGKGYSINDQGPLGIG